MFWICVPSSPTAVDKAADLWASLLVDANMPLVLDRSPVYTLALSAKDSRFTPVGHISLDRVDHDHSPPDLALADPSLPSPLLTITTLFVLPAYAGSRLASFAMKACEMLAQQEPFGSVACRAITVNTVVRKLLKTQETTERVKITENENSVEEWVDEKGKNIWEMLGGQRPSQLRRWDKGAWYERLGFVPFRDLPLDWGEDAKFVYYRKELRTPEDTL